MQNDTFSSLGSPEMIKLAIIFSMKQKKSKHTSSVKNIAEFINCIIYEKKKLTLKEDGVNISKSLFIPYSIMSHDFLVDIDHILDTHQECFFFVDSSDKNNIVFPDTKFGHKTLGICNIVCGFFLAIKDLLTEENELYLMALFDSVVSNVVFEQRVEFSKIITKAMEYGYLGKGQLSGTPDFKTIKKSEIVK
jgi:hypothetical protein